MRALYFGLDPSRYEFKGELVHLPLVRTVPFPFQKVKLYFNTPHSHVLFTSRSAVSYFFAYSTERDKKYICVGKATANRLEDFGVQADFIAENPQGEGVVELLKTIEYEHILYPHSAQSRPLLPDYLKEGGTSFALYDTFPIKVRLPDLSRFDRLIFTSPSSVDAFFSQTSEIPPQEKCEAIGPITRNALNKFFSSIMVSQKHKK